MASTVHWAIPRVEATGHTHKQMGDRRRGSAGGAQVRTEAQRRTVRRGVSVAAGGARHCLLCQCMH